MKIVPVRENSPIVNQVPTGGEFERIRCRAEQACQMAVDTKLKCCANLADLHCVEAVFCVDKDGYCWWVVEIEEASPEDYELQAFIRSKMAMDGVVVRTSW